MDRIVVPISPGELLDKITILQIKSERIESAEKKANVEIELNLLNQVWADAVPETHEHYEDVLVMREELKEVNEALWVIEDDIRFEERDNRFGESFVQLARSVYITNDKRAEIKKRINLQLDSDIVEEKSYQDYN